MATSGAAQRAGKNSRIQIGVSNLRYAEWEVNDQGDDIDGTNFESGGFTEGLVGSNEATWTLRGQWDANLNPYENPPGLVPRPDLGGLKFYENVTDAMMWDFELARVLSSRNGAVVRQSVTFEASGKNQGSYTRPNGGLMAVRKEAPAAAKS